MKCIGLIVASLACLCAVAESGEQAAAQGVCGVRYLRWHYTEVEGGPLDGKTDLTVKGGTNCRGMQLAEIRLMRNDEEIAWPEGTTCSIRVKDWSVSSASVLSKESFDEAPKVIDGDVNTKCYDSDGSGRMMANAFAITLPEAVDFDQYALYSADDDFDRDPTAWRMEVSADGETWYALDNVSGFAVPGARHARFYVSPKVGLDLREQGAAKVTGGTVQIVRPARAVTARHLRWTIEKMWKDNTFLQLSEFAPTYCGRRLPWNPSGTATCSLDSKYSADEAAAHLYDGQVKNGEAKCWHVNVNPEDDPVVVNIDLGKLTTFDGYDICAGDPQAADYRAPGKWTLEAQIPGTDEWAVIAAVDVSQADLCPFRRDSTSAYRVWHSDYSEYVFWSLDPVDGRLTHVQTIPGDVITVDEGATLALTGIGGGFAAGSAVRGTLSISDTRISVANVDLADADVVGTGTFVYPASVTMPPSVPETITLAKEDGTVDLGAGRTLTAAGKLKYLRMKMYSQLKGGTMFQFGELELCKDGEKVAWPAGTGVVTYSHGHPDPADPWLHMPNDPNFNYYGGTYEQLIDGDVSTCMGDSYDFKPDSTEYVEPVDITIVLGDAVDFDSYRFYSGDVPSERLPTKWDIQVSYDGETYFTIDAVTHYDAYAPWMRGQLAYESGAVDWSAVTASPLVDRVADDNGLALAGGAEFALVTAMERVGALSGAGVVAMSGVAPVLIVAGSDPSAVFSGTITGGGVLVVEGGTVVMKRADLRGVSKIVVRSGATLKGTARYDESLVFEVEEGGVNKLRYDSGVLLILR